jgi:hypothetical protein
MLKKMFLLAENIVVIPFMQFIVLHELTHYVMAKILKADNIEPVWFKWAREDDISHGTIYCDSKTELDGALISFAPVIFGFIGMLSYDVLFRVFNLQFVGGIFLVSLALMVTCPNDYISGFKHLKNHLKSIKATTV